MTTFCRFIFASAEVEEDILAQFRAGNFDINFLSRFTLSPVGVEQVQFVFNALDINRDGELTCSEFKNFMKILLCDPNLRPLTDAECNKVMAVADTDGNGKVTLKEFIALLERLFPGVSI